MPAWSGRLCARRSKYLVENVCTSAMAKSAAPMDWMRVGVASMVGKSRRSVTSSGLGYRAGSGAKIGAGPYGPARTN